MILRRLLVTAVCSLLAPSVTRAADPPPVKATNLGAVNTAADEDDPFLTSNGLALYYTSTAAGKADILVARRASPRAPWKAAAPVGGYIQTNVDDRSVCLSAEQRFPQFLYFATKKDKEINNFDLYVAVRQGATSDFSAPTPLNPLATEQDELHPWLTADGRKLYFSRKTKDGWRVLVASRPSATGAAGFGEPALVKELPPDFHHATLSPEGKTMYLQGPLGKERWGLFRSRSAGGAWGKPEPLEELNHPEGERGDRSPCLSRDGTVLFFASDRPGGKGGLDLWAVRVAELKK